MADRLKTIIPHPYEKLLVWRRRRGMTRQQAAAHFKTTLHRYSSWERGQQTRTCPQVSIGELAPNEACVVRRRRANMTQAELARRMGCSRRQVVLMERGEVGWMSLVKHWQRSWRERNASRSA